MTLQEVRGLGVNVPRQVKVYDVDRFHGCSGVLTNRVPRGACSRHRRGPSAPACCCVRRTAVAVVAVVGFRLVGVWPGRYRTVVVSVTGTAVGWYTPRSPRTV